MSSSDCLLSSIHVLLKAVVLLLQLLADLTLLAANRQLLLKLLSTVLSTTIELLLLLPLGSIDGLLLLAINRHVIIAIVIIPVVIVHVVGFCAKRQLQGECWRLWECARKSKGAG